MKHVQGQCTAGKDKSADYYACVNFVYFQTSLFRGDFELTPDLKIKVTTPRMQSLNFSEDAIEEKAF